MGQRHLKPNYKRMFSVTKGLQRWCTAHPTRCFLLLSAFSVLLLYRNALSAGFVYDDIDHVPGNLFLLSWHSLVSHYVESAVAFSTDYQSGPAGVFYRPLFWLSLGFDRFLFGSNPFGFHLVNLLFHWANGCIGFLLLKRLGVLPQKAAAAMMIWLILPINSEAVAWISGRPYCLSTFFLLLSLLFAHGYLRSGSRAQLLGYGTASALAILSHETGLLLLPLTIFLATLNRPKPSYATGILCAVGASADVLYLFLRRAVDGSSPVHFQLFVPSAVTFWKYLEWMLLPIRMSVERSSDLPLNSSWLVATIASCALIALYALSVYLRRRLPEFAAGIVWMGIALLPYSGILFVYQGMAERYTYLASLGFSLAIITVLWSLQASSKQLLMPLFLVWVLWGAWRLNLRVLDWHDEVSLYSSSLQANPDSPVLLYNLGASLEDAGNLPKAILLTRQALALRPNYERAINGLGTMYLRTGSIQDAKLAFEQAIALNSQDEQAVSNLGTAFLRLGRFYEASVRFERALALRPDDVRALTNLGTAHLRLGDLAAAEKNFTRILSVTPNDIGTRCNLAMVMFQQDRWDDAVGQLAAAIKISPSDANPYFFFGVIDEKMGARQAAIEMYTRATQLNPDYVEARVKLKKLTDAK